MKLSAFYLLTLSAGIALAGCSTPTTPPADSAHPKKTLASVPQKNPESIAFNKQSELKGHYTIIGEATVSKYNVAGIKRQKAVIQDRLRELAAAMGGDAIINLKSKGQYVIGTVIIDDQSNHV